MPLKKTLGLPMLTFYGVGMILGAGIYSIIGKAAGIAQNGLWQGFLLAAFAAFLTALSYAELATMFPKAGAEYFYLKHAFPKRRWAAAAVGIMMFFAGAATASTVALAFGGYLQHFLAWPVYAVAASLLVLFTFVNIWGVRESGWFNIAFTLIEVGGLLLFVVLGFQSERFGAALATPPSFATVTSAALIVFAYFGFENIATLAEETKDPGRSIPRAIILSFAISIVLYLGVSLAALALLPPDQLSASKAPLVDASADRAKIFSILLGSAALFSTANTTLIALVSASRILFGISADRALPSWLSRTWSKRKSPWVASLASAAFALLLLPLGGVEMVASVSSLATLVAFIAVNVALVALRRRDPGRDRPFRVPLAVRGIPVTALLGALLSLVFLFQFSSGVYAIGAGCFVAAVGIAWSMKENRQATSS